MPCFVLILLLASPRLLLAILFLFTHYLDRAYHGFLIPLLGFFFLPLTTLAYAWIVNSGQMLGGLNLAVLIVAVLLDLGGLGTGEVHRRRR